MIVQFYTTQPYFYCCITTLSTHFQRTLVCTFYRTYTRLLVGINLRRRPLFLRLLPLFKYFSVSQFISLPFRRSLPFLLGLLSAVLIAVAFHHLATYVHTCRSSFYFAVFSRRGHCRLSTFVFAAWAAGLSFAFPASSCHFHCRAIFIAAVHFVAVQSYSNYCGFSFKAGPFVGLPFLLWSCCRHIHLAAKDAFVVFLFFFVLFQLSYSSSFSRRHFLVAVPIVTFQPIAIHIL